MDQRKSCLICQVCEGFFCVKHDMANSRTRVVIFTHLIHLIRHICTDKKSTTQVQHGTELFECLYDIIVVFNDFCAGYEIILVSQKLPDQDGSRDRACRYA